MSPIIDTHQHLWDLSRFELPWLDGAEPLKRSYLPDDYAAASEGTGIERTIYMEVDLAAHQRLAEADYVLDLIARDDMPTTAAVLSGHPADPGFADYVARFDGTNEIKGFRQVLHVPEAARGACLQGEFVAGVRLLGSKGYLFDVCVRPEELGDAAELAERCPDTQLVLDHCGNADPNVVGRADADADADAGAGDATASDEPYAHTADQWRRDIERLAGRPNVVCKISGVISRALPGWTAGDVAPTIDHCLDAFGPDRVVFGGDWPVCTLGAGANLDSWVATLREIIATRGDAEQRQLLHDNATQIYGL